MARKGKEPSCDRWGTVHGLGEPVSARDHRLVLEMAFPLLPGRRERADFLWGCIRGLERFSDLPASHAYACELRRILGPSDGEELPRCLFVRGCLEERMGRFGEAAESYREGCSHGAVDPELRYFLLNNLGYSLNRLGRHDEAAPCCRDAISVDPRRHNAWKNLAVAREGQGRFAEAAEGYVAAVERCPDDPRALEHLRRMVARLQDPSVIPGRVREWLDALDREGPSRPGWDE